MALPPSINAAKPGSVGTLLSCVEAEIRSDEGRCFPGTRGTSVDRAALSPVLLPQP
ncbi:MAG: hypothetical protein ACLUEQ_06900 [Cloacibacillus evryensis]